MSNLMNSLMNNLLTLTRHHFMISKFQIHFLILLALFILFLHIYALVCLIIEIRKHECGFKELGFLDYLHYHGI